MNTPTGFEIMMYYIISGLLGFTVGFSAPILLPVPLAFAVILLFIVFWLTYGSKALYHFMFGGR